MKHPSCLYFVIFLHCKKSWINWDREGKTVLPWRKCK